METKYNNLQNVVLLSVRFVVATIFLFAAWAKFAFWGAAPAGISGGMLYLIRFLSIVEPLGAAGVLFGVLTRWAAGGLAIIMVGAIILLHFTMGTPFFSNPQSLGWDYDLFILANCIVLIAFGGGKWVLSKSSQNNS